MAQNELQLNQDYKIEYDEKHEQKILVGQVDEQIIEQTPFCDWYAEGKSEYEPDSASMVIIRKYINNYDVVATFGTWCGDSHYLFPKFMKVMDEAGYDPEKLRIYAVDAAKNALNVERQLYEIERIPTFIFYKNNNEKARIIESVEDPIEVWIAKFLEREEEFDK